MILSLFQVALGGAIGACLRYLVQAASLRLLGGGFPVGTLMINVAGSFLMGLLFVILAEKGGMRLAPFLLTGILGGFTTFSTFSLDTITLWERGQSWLSLGYVGASVIFSLAALVAGLQFARSLI
jgi:fluoride exporter